MPFLILAAFLLLPVAEIAVFMEVGGRIGFWPTVSIIILTAVLGTALLHQQGLSVLFRIRENLEANKLPVGELFGGAILVFAGIMLLTPGFITDTIGFVLMVPAVRRLTAAAVARRFLAGAEIHAFGAAQPDPPPGGGPIIDGEFRDVTPGTSPGTGSAGRIPGGGASPANDH